MDICRAAKRRGKYPTLATDTEVNSCFSIQLFRERSSYKRGEPYATMSKVTIGNGGFTVA